MNASLHDVTAVEVCSAYPENANSLTLRLTHNHSGAADDGRYVAIPVRTEVTLYFVSVVEMRAVRDALPKSVDFHLYSRAVSQAAE